MEKNNGEKNINNILYVIIAILSVFLIVLNVCTICITLQNNKHVTPPNNANGNENKVISKLDNTKDWVYDAEYKKDVNVDSYSTDYNTYYVKDIVVPFININSSYATVSNNEIKNVFDDAIKAYNDGTKDKLTYVNECNYSKYVDNDILSILLTLGIGATDIVRPNYYIYNIDLKTGNKLSYNDVYSFAGFDSSNINDKVEKAITSVMNEKLAEYHVGTDFDTYNNESITNYKNSVSNNTLKYFLSNKGELNIIVRLSIPAGMGYYDEVITIR